MNYTATGINAEALHEIAKATDTRLAEIAVATARVHASRAGAVERLHIALDSPRIRTGRGRYRWARSGDEVLDLARNASGRHGERVEQILGDIDAADENLRGLRAARRVQDGVYDRAGGWSRFFLVAGGHIHASMACSTCNNGASATEFGWLPELSGLTEADAVASHGALLCTVCFPTAPVEWTNFYEAQAAAKSAAQCPGSGTWDYPRETARMGFYTGNYGVCSHCGQNVTLTKTNKMRGHKP